MILFQHIHKTIHCRPHVEVYDHLSGPLTFTKHPMATQLNAPLSQSVHGGNNVKNYSPGAADNMKPYDSNAY